MVSKALSFAPVSFSLREDFKFLNDDKPVTLPIRESDPTPFSMSSSVLPIPCSFNLSLTLSGITAGTTSFNPVRSPFKESSAFSESDLVSFSLASSFAFFLASALRLLISSSESGLPSSSTSGTSGSPRLFIAFTLNIGAPRLSTKFNPVIDDNKSFELSGTGDTEPPGTTDVDAGALV